MTHQSKQTRTKSSATVSLGSAGLVRWHLTPFSDDEAETVFRKFREKKRLEATVWLKSTVRHRNAGILTRAATFR